MSLSAKNNNVSIIEIIDDLDNLFYRHVRNIARHLRPADHRELSASAEHDPEKEVMEAYKSSARKWIVLREDKVGESSVYVPIVVFGVIKTPIEGTGIPWMVATEEIADIKRFIARHSKEYINAIRKDYNFLFNYVDKRNVDAIAWLEKCGFTTEPPTPMGHAGRPFHLFYMGSNL